MELSDNYRILYDKWNVILRFHKEIEIKNPFKGTSRIGETTEDTYHPNVKSAMKAFIQRDIRGSKSVEECLKRIENIENRIDEALKGLILSNKELLTSKI